MGIWYGSKLLRTFAFVLKLGLCRIMCKNGFVMVSEFFESAISNKASQFFEIETAAATNGDNWSLWGGEVIRQLLSIKVALLRTNIQEMIVAMEDNSEMTSVISRESTSTSTNHNSLNLQNTDIIICSPSVVIIFAIPSPPTTNQKMWHFTQPSTPLSVLPSPLVGLSCASWLLEHCWTSNDPSLANVPPLQLRWHRRSLSQISP